MKKLIYLLLPTIFYLGCNNANNTNRVNFNDSTRGEEKRAVNEDNELTQIVNDYVQTYNSTFLVDTSYLLSNDTFGIYIKHSCLMDSLIIIPKKYVGIYGLDSFVTHNFSSTVVVKRNNQIVEERHINKEILEDFWTLI